LHEGDEITHYLAEPEKVETGFFLEERRRKAKLNADAANKRRQSFPPHPAAGAATGLSKA
jgi:hypothetical protein